MIITSAQQLGARLRDERQRQARTQKNVGEAAGVRQKTVSNFESDPESAKIETLFKILAALDLALDIKPRSESSESPASGWKEEW